MNNRRLVWFSCGAASAVAAKLAVNKYGSGAVVVYCDTMQNEHPDNQRFFNDIEAWIGQKITRIGAAKSIEAIFDARKYMSGPHGAPCTVELKKMPRFDFQKPDDIHIFGYTAEEGKRTEQFARLNPELHLEWILREHFITKTQCFSILHLAKIPLPVMYGLGYEHNNCLGCVKASSPYYWNKIRLDFPEVFNRRAEQSRRLGVKLIRLNNKRRFLDELPLDSRERVQEDLSCGPECR